MTTSSRVQPVPAVEDCLHRRRTTKLHPAELATLTLETRTCAVSSLAATVKIACVAADAAPAPTSPARSPVARWGRTALRIAVVAVIGVTRPATDVTTRFSSPPTIVVSVPAVPALAADLGPRAIGTAVDRALPGLTASVSWRPAPKRTSAAARKHTVIAHRTDDARDAYALGNQRLFAGDAAGAARAYADAIRLDPGYAASYRGLGLAEAQLGHGARAARALRGYLARAPGAKDTPLIEERLADLR